MVISFQPKVSAERAASVQPGGSSQSEQDPDRQLYLWGGGAGLAGVTLMVVVAVVVGALGLPDASDVETLRDFADIESGRIAEHLLYLGALMLFALHVLVLHRLLRTAHPPAALFGTAIAEFGLVMMAASSLLHVATSPLADLYTSPDTPSEDLQSIEYAWHGAQSVFDTMLTTGVLLVPIGIVLLGLAMRSAPAFGPRLTMLAIGLGTVGIVGATIAVVDPGSAFSAASVVAIVAFHLGTGWRTLTLGNKAGIDLTDTEPTPVH
ncbi:MAG: hypothetical protein OEU32_10350 [Acidimicrobiia bacterium]|nr:hypothetical protein [Acidimicrobiia bacterium]